MRSKSLMVRTCAIVISLIQLAIFVSLASPAFGSQGKNFWQVLFPSSWDKLSHDLPSTVALAFILFGMLALPPLASWTASRSPERMMSLLGVWLSLPCTFIPFLLGIELNELFTVSRRRLPRSFKTGRNAPFLLWGLGWVSRALLTRFLKYDILNI